MYGCFKQLFSKILRSAEYRQHWYEENLGLSIFIQILLLANYNYLIINVTEQSSHIIPSKNAEFVRLFCIIIPVIMNSKS